jgi:two-component system, cell cycle response regulator CpdR
MARILLAEDDDSVRLFLARALRRAGHVVCDMPDGQAALAWISEHPVDLLLADVVMPGMDGIELARRAGDMWPHLRVIFITGFAAVALRAAQTLPRETKVLAKPFHLRRLVSEIDRFLAA